jgi:hypothetical protein
MAIDPVWSNGSPKDLIGKIETQILGFRVTAAVILADVVAEAHVEQVAALNAAETRTGIARMDAGGPGTAGRNKTGHMIDEITHETHDEGELLVGTWGWDNPEEYFIDQEFGKGRIEKANSLHISMVEASAQIKSRIRKALETF